MLCGMLTNVVSANETCENEDSGDSLSTALRMSASHANLETRDSRDRHFVDAPTSSTAKYRVADHSFPPPPYSSRQPRFPSGRSPLSDHPNPQDCTSNAADNHNAPLTAPLLQYDPTLTGTSADMDMDVMQHAGNLFDSSEEEVVEVEEEDFAIEAADAPETVDYLAVLVLPDCDFFIKAPLVTLGRGPVPQVYRLSQSPDAGSDDLSQPSRKRKRDAPDHLDGVADRFQGGLGGELSQAPLEELDDFTDTDGQRINVYPGANESGELMHPKCISRRHLQIFWVPSRDAWCVKVLGRNGVYLDGHFLGIGEAAQLAPGAKLSVKGLEFGFWDVYPNTEPEVLDSGEDMDVDNDDDGDDEDELEQVEVRPRADCLSGLLLTQCLSIG